MPRQIYDKKEFINLSKDAEEFRIKRVKDAVKLKLRTKRALFVIKLDPDEAEEVRKKINIDPIEY